MNSHFLSNLQKQSSLPCSSNAPKYQSSTSISDCCPALPPARPSRLHQGKEQSLVLGANLEIQTALKILGGEDQAPLQRKEQFAEKNYRFLQQHCWFLLFKYMGFFRSCCENLKLFACSKFIQRVHYIQDFFLQIICWQSKCSFSNVGLLFSVK